MGFAFEDFKHATESLCQKARRRDTPRTCQSRASCGRQCPPAARILRKQQKENQNFSGPTISRRLLFIWQHRRLICNQARAGKPTPHSLHFHGATLKSLEAVAGSIWEAACGFVLVAPITGYYRQLAEVRVHLCCGVCYVLWSLLWVVESQEMEVHACV